MLASYGMLDRMPHRIALGPALVRHMSFDLQCALAWRGLSPQARQLAIVVAAARPVYIAGLARSGTTVLLRILLGTGVFKSQTYRDMPFVLAPRLWGRLRPHGNGGVKSGERAHGDGLEIDADTAEAFEEIFWKTHCQYETSEGWVTADAPDTQAMQRFAAFRALVAGPLDGLGNGLRYLSKNNNNLLRLRALLADQDARVVVPFRKPLGCARSLHRLHRRFIAMQSAEPFVREYMDSLLHHEFGAGHVPLEVARGAMPSGALPDQPDYWLHYWSAVHEFLLAQPSRQIILSSHDALLARPMAILKLLHAALGIEADASAAVAQINRADPVYSEQAQFGHEAVERAERVHWMLLADPRTLKAVQEGA